MRRTCASYKKTKIQLQSQLRASLRLIPYELPCEMRYLQEAQLSQEGRATLYVVENLLN